MASISSLLASLVREGTDGAVAGERDAALDRDALEDRLSDPPETFVDDHELQALLESEFPPFETPPVEDLFASLDPPVFNRYIRTWEPGRTALRPYEVFRTPSADQDDLRSRFERLESLLERDPRELPLERRGAVEFLTPAAVDEITAAIAEEVGSRRRDALRRVAESGIPEPVVEDIELDVKLAIDETLDATTVDPHSSKIDSDAIASLSTRLHFK